MHRADDIHYRQHFTHLQRLRLPTSAAFIARMLIGLLLLLIVALAFSPWVQTATGFGQVISLDPQDRPQSLQATVDGRIEEWLVQDGQIVQKSQQIASIVDNDPQLLMRLEAERDALKQKLALEEIASQTAQLDFDRQTRLHQQGLSSRREMEQAKIRLKEMMARVSDAQAGLNQAQVRLSRLSTQMILAPMEGMVTNLRASGAASFIRAGDVIADIVPLNHAPAVEMFVSGLDAPLVEKGREVRLVFEGWPAVQFSGWPSVAVGTFKGRVLSIDPASRPDGSFRVIVLPEEGENSWPDRSFLRFGARVRAWVLLETVPLGFELWRQLNGFPPLNQRVVASNQPEKSTKP